jgi:hypothetical protein
MDPRAFLLAALFFVTAGPAAAGPPMSSGTNSISRDASASGGKRSSSPSYNLDATIGENATWTPGATTSSNRLAAGYGEIYASPGPVNDLNAAAAASTTTVALTWSAPGYDGTLGGLQTGSSYYIQWSTYTGATLSFSSAQVVVATSGVNPGDAQALTVSSLLPNTTTFLRLWTLDADGNLGALSNGTTTTTLARALQFSASPFPMIAVSSISAGWGALPASPQSATAEGYVLQASTASNFSGTLFSSATVNVAVSTLTLSGLSPATTYYFRAGALNWQGTVNYVAFSSAVTNPTPPPNYPVYSSPQVSTSSVTGPWVSTGSFVSSTTVNARVSVQNTVSGLLVSTTQPAGLIAQWHLDESSGTGALDASGGGNNGTLVGGSSWTTGQFGQALYFDGATQFFYGANSITAPDVFTMELWFKTNTTSGGRLIGFGNSQITNSGNYDRHVYMTNSGQLYFGVYPNSVQTVNTAASYNDGAWHHVAATLSGAGMFLYVDGSLAGSNVGVTSGQAYSGWWRVAEDNLSGWTNQPTSNFFNGTIDEVRIYTTALSAAQIAADYSADSLAAQTQGAAYSVLFSSTAGSSWNYAPVSSVTMSGANGTTSLQTFQVNGLPLAVSTGPNSSINQIQFVSESLGGSVTETKYYVQVDTVPPTTPTFASLTNPATNALTLNGLSASDALSGLPAAPFDAQASTDSAFGVLNADSGWIAGPAFSFSGLLPNTTYFARARAQDAAGGVSLYSSTKSLSTLSLAPAGVNFTGFSASSATVAWTALLVTPSSSSSEGYELDASSTNFGALLPGGTVSSSITAQVQASTLSVFGLVANTTYYFRAASLNWAGATNYLGISSASTLSNLVVNPATAAVFASSVTVSWGIPALGSEGYVLQASTSSVFNGVITSSSSASGATTTLNVSSLFSATTYFFRVGSINWNGLINYALAGSSVTPPSVDVTSPTSVANLSAATNTANSMLLTWSGPTDVGNNPLSGSYAIQYATYTTVTFSTSAAQVFISTSGVSPGAAQSAVVTGLSPNTTYFFRLWTSDVKPNWSDISNGATVATLAQVVTGSQVLSLTTATAGVGWGALPASPSSFTAEGYRVEASSTNFGAVAGGGTVYSSATANLTASTLTISGLDPNTTYYYRVASLNWAGAADYASAGSSATLAIAPTAITPVFLGIFPSSLTVNWAALRASPSSATSEGYELDASSTNFSSGLIYSSVTFVNAASTLTVAGLDSNTTYFLRVAALNWGGAPNYSVLAATSTEVQVPASLPPAFTAATLSVLSAQWAAGGNAPGTLYRIDLSTAADFSGTLFSSSTYNLFADVTGLAVNTAYYARVSATGNSGRRSPFLGLGSSATLASQPLAGSGFSGIGLSAITVAFANGSPVNPANTLYDVQISQDPAFSSYASSQTYNFSATFNGLLGGTLYYFRAAAINLSSVETAFTSLGSTSTLSSLPVYSGASVSTNAVTGPWNPVAGYVSSTTANVRVTVQDAITGLLVSTTQPAALITQWHLDESGGSAALDASGSGDVGTIVGGATWVSGRDGLALSLNGSTQYVYGSNSMTGPDVFTLEMWFKTTTTNGGKLIGFGNTQTGNSTSYDRQIYMTNSGQLYFGVYPGSVQTVNTTASFNDGTWHHVAATLSPAGMNLYVDGSLIGSNAGATSGQAFTGWWRVGDDNIGSWVNVPNSYFFNGAIDEVRIYTTARTATQIAADYSADTLAAQNQGAAYSVLYSSTAGSSWSYAPVSSVTMTGSNGTTTAQTFQVNGLPLVASTGTNSTINQVQFVAQDPTGDVTETKYYVQIDTVAPPTPSFSSLTGPTTYGLTLNGLSGSDALSGLAAAPFDVQASTDPAFGIVNADAGWNAGPTIGFSGLNPNTTYYARARAQDAAGNVSGFTGAQALATLALAPSGTAFVNVSFSSASYAWTVRQVSPSSFSAEGYQLDVSTMSDFSGTVLSSAATAVVQSTLAVVGLDLTTTEYFRVAALNWAGVPNYAAASPLNLQLQVSTTILSFGNIDPSISLSSVSASSIVVTNVGNVPVTVALWSAVVTQPSSPWSLAASSGTEQAVIQGLWNSTRPPGSSFVNAILPSTTTSAGGIFAGDQSGQAVPSGATRVIWFQFWAPMSTTATNKQTLRVDMLPVYP